MNESNAITRVRRVAFVFGSALGGLAGGR